MQFTDGETKELTANLITESMFSGINNERRHFQILFGISKHRKNDTALEKKDGFYEKEHGPNIPQKTTKGWELNVHWKDGSYDWVKLKDLKFSNPVELGEYTVAKGIQDKPDFKWLIAFTLKKRNMIVRKIKSKY